MTKDGKLKILHAVEFYEPSVGGMQEVVKQISERLAALGHDVTIATTALPNREKNVINGVKIVGFDILGNYVRGTVGDAASYEKFLLESDFDVVTNFAAQQWTTDLALPLLPKIKAKKVFVPTGMGGIGMPAYKEYYQKMRTWMKGYDMNVFLSHDYYDTRLADEIGITKRAYVPNGAAADEFLSTDLPDIRNKFGLSDQNLLILLVGSHTGAKGHAEAMKIFSKAKIKNAALLIVGNVIFGGGCKKSCSTKSLLFNYGLGRFTDRKEIIVASLSRKETVGAYIAADLFLFPSQTECSPIVLFECMASKTPFLTSNVGNAKEIIEWSHGGLLLPTVQEKIGPRAQEGFHVSHVNIDESAVLLEDIARDRKRLSEMGEAGFRAWQERFTWEKIAKNYEKIYLNIVKR